MKKTIANALPGLLIAIGGCTAGAIGGGASGNGLTAGFGALTLEGETVAAGAIDPACDGFYPAAVSETMTLAEPLAGLAVRVTSDSPDVALWITDGTNNFCSREGETEVTRGNWSAGTYEIRVGSRVEGDAFAYTIDIVE